MNYTAGNHTSAMTMLLEGAGLTVIVVFLFLRDFRATLISAVALPLSIIPTFWAMEMLGFSMNLVSLLAIILVTGILVDDAIVEIENIVRHMKMGKSPYRASMEAADEIGLAVIAISLTIVAVFAPVSFMGGIAGQYFKQFGLVVAIAVLFSLLVARLITPMLAAYFLRPHAHKEPKDGVMMRGYLRFLSATIRFRYVTLLAGIAVFAVSIWAIRFLPTGFIPFPDEARFVVSMELPPGSTLEDTRASAPTSSPSSSASPSRKWNRCWSSAAPTRSARWKSAAPRSSSASSTRPSASAPSGRSRRRPRRSSPRSPTFAPGTSTTAASASSPSSSAASTRRTCRWPSPISRPRCGRSPAS